MDKILEKLKMCDFKVSTDTRKDVSGTVYFALSGENFDGNTFIADALHKGALCAVTENPKNASEHTLVVKNVLKTLQNVAHEYRKQFTIPIITIGGSNGKTTSKELLRNVLRTKYKVHATEGSLNNHIGVPLSILSMSKDTGIGVFEIGANHPKEHTELLNILEPTHVVVTNNGMDHLEGFGTPEGSRKANKEIYDWALEHKKEVFVNKKNIDLIEDSKGTKQIIYSDRHIMADSDIPLSFVLDKKTYTTNLAGKYNLENIELAVAIGKHFSIDIETALEQICQYTPSSKRSQILKKNDVHYIMDCYNANPTSMMLALESFIKSIHSPRGVILGDMFELGTYSQIEHKKIVDYVFKQNINVIIFIGKDFKNALIGCVEKYEWFETSEKAKGWFVEQKFSGYTFLLKGSRGSMVEKILG